MTRTALPLAALLSTAALAQAAPHFDPARLSRHVEVLSSDAYEGRGPATPGETKAVDYIVGQFKAAGVQPGGDLKDGKRAWTQDVPLLRSAIVGAPALSITSNGATIALTQGEQIAVRADGPKACHAEGRAAGVRRLWRGGARAQLGRFQGR